MKRVLTVLGSVLVLIGLMLPVFATSQETFTFCHAAGQDDTTQFVTLTLPFEATFGQAGHFNEDGTTQAGHEQDYLGECIVDSTTTTTTLEGTTTTLGEGTTTTLGEGSSTTTLVEVNPICVDCNNATQADLMQLTGVNASLALEIIANRPYETVQDLVTKGVMTPGQLLLILAVNLNTGAFVGPECLSATVLTTVPGDTTTTLATTTTTAPIDELPFTGLGDMLPWASVALLGLGGLTLLAARRLAQ